MTEIERAAKRIVSKIEAGQVAEAPRRVPASFIVNSGQFFVPERISMFMRPNPGERSQAGKGISPVAVRKEFRPIVKDKEWVPRYMLQGLGEVELDLEARVAEARDRARSRRRRVERFLVTGRNREKAAKAIAVSATKAAARRIAGKQLEGLGQIPWLWLTDAAQGAADYVQDTIIGIPGSTEADRVNLQNLQEIAEGQKAEREAAGQSTKVQDRLLSDIQQSQADLYEPTSVMVTETVNELKKRTKKLIKALPSIGKYVAIGIAGLAVLMLLKG